MRRKYWVRFFLLGILLILSTGMAFAIEKPESEVTLKTSSAEFDETTGFIYAKGQSTIQWRGVTMTCPYLEVDTVKQEAKSDGEIKVTWEDKMVLSRSLFFVGKEKKVSMTDIQGKGKDFTFQTKAMDFLFSTGKIILTGDPVLRVKDFQIKPQRIEYTIDTKKWQATAVSIVKEGWLGQSNSAFYQEGTEFILLEGNARVEKNGNLLRGEKILINTLTGKVKVEGNVEINIIPSEGESN